MRFYGPAPLTTDHKSRSQAFATPAKIQMLREIDRLDLLLLRPSDLNVQPLDALEDLVRDRTHDVETGSLPAPTPRA
jgi:hypothetical protein